MEAIGKRITDTFWRCEHGRGNGAYNWRGAVTGVGEAPEMRIGKRPLLTPAARVKFGVYL